MVSRVGVRGVVVGEGEGGDRRSVSDEIGDDGAENDVHVCIPFLFCFILQQRQHRCEFLHLDNLPEDLKGYRSNP